VVAVCDASGTGRDEGAEKGGLGYGELKGILKRLLAYFGPMRERCDAYAKRPDDVEEILRAGAVRAREIARPVLSRCREAAGFRA
jgi:tryptophanyl-tRNA synthetase